MDIVGGIPIASTSFEDPPKAQGPYTLNVPGGNFLNNQGSPEVIVDFPGSVNEMGFQSFYVQPGGGPSSPVDQDNIGVVNFNNHTGSGSFRLEDCDEAIEFQSENLEVAGINDIQVSLFLKVLNANYGFGDLIQLFVLTDQGAFNFLDLQGNDINNYIAPSNPGENEAWVEHTFNVPNGVNFVQLIVVCASDQDGEGIQIDDISFVAAPSGPTTSLFEPPTASEPLVSTSKSATCPPPGTGGGCGGGDSIYLFSGEFHQSAVDLQIKGRGMDFVWARKYRSRVGSNSAMGNGWDFSYNISIQPNGPDIQLFDGNTRQDLYSQQPDGSWSADGLFRTITIDDPNDPINSPFRLTFADTGQWTFLPLVDPNTAGKLSSIIDRNGNTMNFLYDAGGRLTTIQDTLHTANNNREITIAYDPNTDLITSVTDFIGRTVTYEYYEDGDAGGSAGDLKSVTTPVVTGTPHGNDFPSGKTTTYTYATGFGDETLNHNLLTITDPKGQTYLTNIYSTETDPLALNFDRVVRQILGDPNDFIDFVYIPVVPDPNNLFSINQTIVNDRVGNVTEFFYDDKNQNVITREYTGRADEDLPTTDSTNRPTGKLRLSDPDFFETRTEYNNDFLPVLVTKPKGNAIFNVYEVDLDPNAPARSSGNLRERHRLPGPLAGISDPNVIIETFEYDSDFGGCCGSNFVTRHVDGRGNETTHEYDSSGNRLKTTHRIPSIVDDYEYNEFGQLTKHIHPDNGSNHRRIDIFNYYSESSSADFNFDDCVNYLDFSLFVPFWEVPTNSIYDIAPAGGDGIVDILDLKLFTDNWLDCPVGTAGNSQNGYLRSIIVDADNLQLTTSYTYDPVGNVVRSVDPRGNDTLAEYNALDQVVRSLTREETKGNGVRYERLTYYDGNDNVVRVDVENRDETGALQSNTHFTTIYEYEILNHTVRKCRESGSYTGAIPGSINLPVCTGLPDAEFITTEFEYDGNRNRTLIVSGEAAEGRQPLNVVQTLYDERDLVYQDIRAPGDPNDQSTIQFDYDSNRNKLVMIDGLEESPRVTSRLYDGYDRLLTETDPMGNVATFTYDNNYNVTNRRVDGDPNDAPGDNGHIRLAEVTNTYDAMDRLIQSDIEHFTTATGTPIGDGKSTTTTTWSDYSQVILVTNDNSNSIVTEYDTANRVRIETDSKGNTIEYTYDTNSNVIEERSTDKSDTGASDQVFFVTNTYDGLNRLIAEVDNVGNTHTHEYDSRSNRVVYTDASGSETRYAYDGMSRQVSMTRDLDGDGADGDAVDIVVITTWDDTSRLATETDDNGNTTTYTYDNLNRLVVETYADSTSKTCGYDVHDNKILEVDANGSVVTSTYDFLDREIARSIVVGAGVSSDTTFEAYTYDGLSRCIDARDDDSVVLRSFDSMSNIISEILNGQTTTATYDGLNHCLVHTYPGGRQITRTYDSLERVKTVTDTTGAPVLVATYDYYGQDRSERNILGNSTLSTFEYDGVSGIPNAAGDFGNRQIVRTTHTQNVLGDIDERTYRWDAMHNLTRRSDVRLAGPQVIHDYTYDDVYRLIATNASGTLPISNRTSGYTYDGVGNRTSVTGTLRAGSYTLDVTSPDPADSQMNQYTTTPFDLRVYDLKGNLVVIDPNLPSQIDIEYDYLNRMVRFDDSTSGEVTTYEYDAIGRRTERVTDATGTPDTTRYYYDGWQVIEERDGVGAVDATYVYGRYIDEVITMNRGIDYYYHYDNQFNVVALTNPGGNVVERYEYDDYGQPLNTTTLQPVVGPVSSVGNPYLFSGRRYDPESGWYYYRTRYLDPLAGRFTTRDSIGIWEDTYNHGNGYAYVGNNPLSLLDPMGELTHHSSGRIYGDSKAQSQWEGDHNDTRGMGAGARSKFLEKRMKSWAYWELKIDYECTADGKPKPGASHLSYSLPKPSWNLLSRTPPKPDLFKLKKGPTVRSDSPSIGINKGRLKGLKLSVDFKFGITDHIFATFEEAKALPCPKGLIGEKLEMLWKIRWVRKDSAGIGVSAGKISTPKLNAVYKRTKAQYYHIVVLDCCKCPPPQPQGTAAAYPGRQ